MEKIELKLDGVTSELVIREGEAQSPLPLKEPKIININGDIHSVANFIKSRESGFSSQAINKDKAIVVVNKDGKIITLQLDPENFYGATVTAKLEQSEELKQFGINIVKRYRRQALVELIKFNRIYFQDKTNHALILSKLQKLRIKSSTEIEQEKSNQGSKRNLIDVSVIDDGGLPKEFNLTIPLYKGFPAENITVELCYDLLDGDVSFWLESVGLKEVMESQIDGIFEEELKAAEGFVIINQ